MPLFKRKPFPLAEPREDIKPNEQVFQIRFTKEIFRDYQEYLERINLYRQRVWICKVSGKTNLTYEEALVSERRATEKVQHFPKELIGTVLRMVQFKTLRVKELVSKISNSIKDFYLVGEEVTGRKKDSIIPCKILKVIQEIDDSREHFASEVGFLAPFSQWNIQMEASTRLLVLTVAMALHFFKRVVEVLFIHRYSGGIGVDTAMFISLIYSLEAVSFFYVMELSEGLPLPTIDLMPLGIA